MTDRPETCCGGFTRSEALRRRLNSGAAREWDPRMPVPAGAGIDRRRFLLGGAGGLLSVYGAGRLGLTARVLGEGVAQAAATQTPASPVLVSIFLAGGIDALSVLAPVGDPLYAKLRPTLALPASTGTPFGEDPRLHWHPAAASFAKLHAAGKVTTLPSIGYSHPDMSHFTSRHYWEVGATETSVNTGWLGRYLDTYGTAANPLQGLSLDGAMNPTIATARTPVAAIDRPETFTLWLSDVWGDVFDYALDAAGELGGRLRRSADPAIAQVADAASEVGTLRAALAPFRDSSGKAAYGSTVTYPAAAGTDVPQRLAGLAAMLGAGLPIKCVALTSNAQFDTHSAQAGAFESDLSVIADAIGAFQADIEARGIADRVLVHVWSEFGRRAQENGSAGTDHGAAGVSLLIGTRAGGTMIGEYAGLASLDANGNQIENTDFRTLYCSLLEQWFGADAASVIPGAKYYPRYQLLK